MISLTGFRLPSIPFRRAITSIAASSSVHIALLSTLAVVAVRAHQGADSSPKPTIGSGHSAMISPAEPTAIDGSLANALSPLHAAHAAVDAAASRTADDAVTSGAAAIAHIAPAARFPFPAAPNTELAGLFSPAEPSLLEEVELLDASKDDVRRAEASKPQDKDHQLVARGAAVAGRGADAGDGGNGNAGSGNSFFGLEAAGDRIVFVVDISGSMNGHRFFRARGELRRSIEKLRENQQFFVIFFNDGALPMPAEKLLPATRQNVSRTLEWIEYVECGGGTNPLPGLLLALELKPDAIYLLTDGKFDRQVVWEVAQAEPIVPIPIYTISFASRSAEKLLKNIAASTGGIYRFVR